MKEQLWNGEPTLEIWSVVRTLFPKSLRVETLVFSSPFSDDGPNKGLSHAGSWVVARCLGAKNGIVIGLRYAGLLVLRLARMPYPTTCNSGRSVAFEIGMEID